MTDAQDFERSPLDEWLQKRDAKLLWAKRVDGVGLVTASAINGWEMFVPASPENSIAARR